MASVFLVGFMGVGKSATATALGGLLDLPVIDLDEAVERDLGMSIAEVFARDGEAAFRAAEHRLLRELLASGDDRIVALGGGAFCSAENRRLIAAAGGVSVFLDLPLTILRRRLPGADPSRPLLDPERVADLYAARRPDYARATAVVPLDGTETAAEVARKVLEEVMCAS